MIAAWVSFRNSLDTACVWGAAFAGYFCRIFVLPKRVRIPEDLHEWLRFGLSFALVMGGVILQEHFRSKDRAGRIKNSGRRLGIAFLLGLGAGIGD